MHAALASGGEVRASVLLPGDLGVGVAGGGTFEAGRGAGPDGDVVGHFGEGREHCGADRVVCGTLGAEARSGFCRTDSRVSARHSPPFVQRPPRTARPCPHKNQEQGFLSAADRSRCTGSS